MKKRVIVILAAVLLFSLTACNKQLAVRDVLSQDASASETAFPQVNQASESESSASDLALPEVDLQALDLEKLRAEAAKFAVHFSEPFKTTKELDPTTIGRFIFWELYELGVCKEESSADPIYFEKADVEERVFLRFGIQDFDYPQPPSSEKYTIYPRFDYEKQMYAFYPEGGNPWIDTEIVDEKLDERNRRIYYTINTYDSALGVEQPDPIFRQKLLYEFEIVADSDGKALLRAVSATEVS